MTVVLGVPNAADSTQLGTTTVTGGTASITLSSPWGIDAQGQVYVNDDGTDAAPGEIAYMGVDANGDVYFQAINNTEA